MTAEQLRVFLARLVENGSAFMGLSKEDAQWAIEKPREAIALIVEAFQRRRVVAPQKGAEAVKAALLQFVATVELSAFTPAFKVSERFVVNTMDEAVVKISYVEPNFLKWFGEQAVSSQAAATLSYHVLQRDAWDREIIPNFGGEKVCAVTLANIWSLLLLQPKGKEGVLLTNGWANVFYIWDDGASALRAVFVRWGGYGWRVFAIGLDCNGWHESRRVFVPSSSSVGSSC